MTENKLAIDFGNSNTVCAMNEALQTAETISLPEFSDALIF
jgi:pantothenate kinase type III